MTYLANVAGSADSSATDDFLDLLFEKSELNDKAWVNHDVFGDREFATIYHYLCQLDASINNENRVLDYSVIASSLIESLRPKEGSESIHDVMHIRKTLFRLFGLDSAEKETIKGISSEVGKFEINCLSVLNNRTSLVFFNIACFVLSLKRYYPTIDVNDECKTIGKGVLSFFKANAYFFGANNKVDNESWEWLASEIDQALLKLCHAFMVAKPRYMGEFTSLYMLSSLWFLEEYKKLIAMALAKSFSNTDRFRCLMITSLSHHEDWDTHLAEIQKSLTSWKDTDAKLKAQREDQTPEELLKRIEYGSFQFKYSQNDDLEEITTYYYNTRTLQLDNVEALRNQFPNCSEVIDFVKRHLMLNLIAGGPFRLPPMCLKGPGGTGKSHFCVALTSALNASVIEVHASQITCGSILVGLQRTWSNAKAGMLVEKMAVSQIVNPVVIFDELSSLDRVSETSGINPKDALLRLLDVGEAARFVDGFTLEKIDMSKISWIFTANHLNNLSEAFKTRLEVFDIAPIAEKDLPQVIDGLCGAVIKEMDLEGKVEISLDDMTRKVLVNHLKKGNNFRKFKKMIGDGVLNYCTQHFDALRETPLEIPHKIGIRYFE